MELFMWVYTPYYSLSIIHSFESIWYSHSVLDLSTISVPMHIIHPHDPNTYDQTLCAGHWGCIELDYMSGKFYAMKYVWFFRRFKDRVR